MRNKKREPRFLRFSKRLLVMSFIVFVVGIVALNSYESTINVACNKLEKDIKNLMEDNSKLKQEIRRLQSEVDSTNNAPSRSISNVDLLKRISNLEKIVYGNNE